MGQKDLTEKNFLLHPDVYADTLNALAYAGREVVRAEDLLPAPTESFYHAGRGKLAAQFSDAAMYEMKNGMILVQYILENEVQAKNRTVLRKAGYEGAWKFITNERLHVYAMAHLPKQVRNRFQSDMRIVVDYLAERQDYKPTKQRIIYPEALLLMLQALTGDMRYSKIFKYLTEEDKKGELTMCELLDKYENRGIQKGIQQGESRYAALNEKLIKLGRMDDLCKAAGSKRYRSLLYKEFGLV